MKQNQNDQVQCSCCGGTGTVALTGVYFDTLGLLRKQKEEIHGAALARIAGCNATAMNNRLAYLEENGFVTSCVYGRKKLFSAIRKVN